MRHGGNLRWFSLSRELLLRGHHVYFAVNRHPLDELTGRRQYLEEMRRDGVISGFVELEYVVPRRLSRLAHLLTYPPLVGLCLRRYQAQVMAGLRSAIARHGIDLCVVSDRALLFVIPSLVQDLPVVVDWADSLVLHGRRNLRLLRGRGPLATMRSLRNLVAHYVRERYYTRRSSTSLVVSPVDKACVDGVSGCPGQTRVLLNGIDMPAAPPTVLKNPGRLIFTGNMDFPPNYQAALWFIDEVFPLITRERPEVVFVVAGRNPGPELRSRAGERVVIAGSVDDMIEEIARSALYVAPLISGGGFKNKVLEAIASGTYVVATPLAVEFLHGSLRDDLLLGETAGDFARQVLTFLGDRPHYDARLPRLQACLRREFTWAGRATELLDLAFGLLERPGRRAGP
jgi:glycosyltransferase involved in cell wall biosynthesis